MLSKTFKRIKKLFIFIILIIHNKKEITEMKIMQNFLTFLLIHIQFNEKNEAIKALTLLT